MLILRRGIDLPRFVALLMMSILVLASVPATLRAQDDGAKSDPAAMALYADAANFQTNGAVDLAIENWQQFLSRYPDHKLAPKVAHYLGVCYMQSDPPELIEAARAFGQALQNKKYELREESLSNRGWCFYAAAIRDDKIDKGLLQESLNAYKQLLKENPKSRYRERAFFYSGEAAYTMGDPRQAIDYYSKLLAMDGAEKSPLRCDALYARGIAQEEIDELDAAAESYEQLLRACVESDLVVDVQLRLGDIHLFAKRYDRAIGMFQKVIDDPTDLATDADRAHALFRQGFSFARLKKADEAAERYERLVKQYPESQYTTAATLAAAQTRYQSGEMDAAADGFRKLLGSDDVKASTEAAHWLARIELAKASAAPTGSPEMQRAAEKAYSVASTQLDVGAEGDYALTLRLDAAEALSFQNDKLADALALFVEIANNHPTSPLAARAIYNGAFTALQLGEHDRAIRLADDFGNRYSDSPLAADAAFIAAEARLLSGDADEAAKRYQGLIDNPAYRNNPQRVQWILRGATAHNSAGQPKQVVSLLAEELSSIDDPSSRAEALLLSGQARLKLGDAAAAAEAFRESREADPKWARSDEAFLLAGEAQMQAGNRDAAVGVWRELISTNSESKLADQARFKLGQLASDEGRYSEAIDEFDPVIQSGRDATLLPFALYGKGWAQMSLGKHDDAVKTLSLTIEKFPEHAIRDDALLARGISHRSLEDFDNAAIDLTQFLDTDPSGILRGHGLYELALVRQNQNRPEQAAERLAELVHDVPDYPGMDKVVYELGWSLKEAGQEDQAIEQFELLIETYPDNPMVNEAAYFVGQKRYNDEDWDAAAQAFEIAAQSGDASSDEYNELLEKSLYRLGWSYFKAGNYPAAEAAFVRQFREASSGPLYLDAMMMVGEARFKQQKFDTALRAYGKAREKIEADNDTAQSIRDNAERQVRELTLLHGGQSAAQLKDWDTAINWYDELRKRFPATTYLPQVFYETGFAHQQAGNEPQALKLYGQVANNYRNELAARARFMMGEIHFANKSYSDAIPEFQRVMYGFGAEKADPSIKNWQAKSGFEAGRCAESLFDVAKTESAKEKARGYAVRFYEYVVNKHPGHELAAQSRDRLAALKG
ncbi:MAG: tetratricopeptide repeat protein [Rhodopirellula sp. JB044]|uniref:tetratricopeptide repeat protein n=1 Tax=Rhodopirellula sp. JB044 TaxID=3342844 RepID=UPI00370C0880